jgi:Ca2+-binding RTX toxin-like protein
LCGFEPGCTVWYFETMRESPLHLSRSRRARLVVVSALIACTAVAPAQAGTVEFDGAVTFRAAPGESNNVEITESAGGVFTIVDSVPLTTESCFQADLFTAVCSIEFGISVAAELGDLDDTAVVVANYIDRVEGGAGADTITTSGGRAAGDVWGGPGEDTLVDEGEAGGSLRGGGGSDTLRSRTSPGVLFGGGGDDLLDLRDAELAHAYGQGGDDRLIGGLGRDVLDGGVGHDTLHGKGRSDHLAGGSGKDVLIGGRGRDQIWGNRGDDLIVGGSRRDLVYGGHHDDTFRMRDGELDRVWGGRGFDRARIDRRLDRIFRVEARF